MLDLEKEFTIRINELKEKFLSYPLTTNKEIYCEWMNQQYYLIQNTTRYLALSASKVGYEDREDFREWVHHLEEEMDHDLMIIRDLKAIGYEANNEIMPITKAIIATQYKDIETHGPNALLGYALLLEGVSCEVCGTMAENVEKLLESKKGSTYLKLHATVDQEHFPEGMEKIKKLDETQKKIVFENLRTMHRLYCLMLDEIVENNLRKNKVTAKTSVKQRSFEPTMTL